MSTEEDSIMHANSPYDESFNNLIRTIRTAEDISFFNYMVDATSHIAIIDITHVCLETAVDVIVAAFNSIAVKSTAYMMQVYQIVKEIHDSHKTQDHGFIKSVNADLVSAVLISAPYRENHLDVRIAIADSEVSIPLAKDFIFYELGLTSLKSMRSPTFGDSICLT